MNHSHKQHHKHAQDRRRTHYSKGRSTKKSKTQHTHLSGQYVVPVEQNLLLTAHEEKIPPRLSNNGADTFYDPNDVCCQALQRFWGHSGFRPMQREIIEALRQPNGPDILVTMGTGSGKSVCYQIPGIVDGGLTLIVSPLISLMHDQVKHLTLAGIPGACLCTGQTLEEQQEIIKRVESGQLYFLYVSPERLTNMEAQLRRWNPKWIIVDESHCISQFGSFREDYRQLGQVRAWTPQSKFAAFTATATEQTQADICQQLGMQQPACFIASVDRPNLFYTVQARFKTTQDFWKKQLLPIVQNHYLESGIVYCLSRKETESVAAYLQQEGIHCLAYHAGLEMPLRTEIQNKFMSGEVHVIVSTIALGLGLDKSNIRYIVHTSLPSTIEAYSQESGRCGRDGDLGHCYLFFSGQDFRIRESFLKEIQDEQHLLSMKDKLQAAWRFCQNKHECYHKQLVHYFGQHYDSVVCRNRCSSCVGTG